MSVTANLLEQVERSILSRKLFAKGDAILVAVSGGVDSMVLLRALSLLSKAHQWRLTVAHFNHQLRGRSSDADERLVERVAKKLGLPFVSGCADVKSFARKNKVSLEMAARSFRHDFLATNAIKHKIKKIALAHHADDQVELFFLRLLRGSSSESLAGMKWQNASPSDAAIKLVRPLLDQTKSALTEFAEEQRIEYREDATNGRLDFQRNRIRNELLPLLLKKYQPALPQVVLRQMKIIGAEAEFVTATALDWLKEKRSDFEALAVAVQRRVLHIQLERLELRPNFDLIEELRQSPDRLINVGADLFVLRDGKGSLHVQKSLKHESNTNTLTVSLHGNEGSLSFDGAIITWMVKPLVSGTFRALKGEVNCENFDAAKLGKDVVLRHWLPGDRFRPLGMAPSVKVQDLLVNRKIPKAERHQLLVGMANGEIFWVEGLRLGEGFKLDKNSRYQLKWCWKRV